MRIASLTKPVDGRHAQKQRARWQHLAAARWVYVRENFDFSMEHFRMQFLWTPVMEKWLHPRNVAVQCSACIKNKIKFHLMWTTSNFADLRRDSGEPWHRNRFYRWGVERWTALRRRAAHDGVTYPFFRVCRCIVVLLSTLLLSLPRISDSGEPQYLAAS